MSPAPWRRIPPASPELSDLLASYDRSGTRGPLARDAILAELAKHGNEVGRAIALSLPARDGTFDADAVDAKLLEAHVELQRLSEEFDHGRRAAELVLPLVRAARRAGCASAMRVTDVGCGLAYVPRYLAFHRALEGEVTLAGRDFNPTLIAHARGLAAAEGIEVDLAVGDAADLTEPGERAGIAISTGLLHHLRPDDLAPFFARQRTTAWAFAHFDFQPSALAPFGAWLFHLARFRSALARHDGVLSALRAHSAATLLDAATDATGEWNVALCGARIGPLPRVFHAVVGVRSILRDSFVAALGWRADRLGPWR
jgi:SAM-dependent methyltransferase